MCIFLLLVFRDERALAAARLIAPRYAVGLKDAAIVSLQKRLHDGECAAFASRGMCDCSTRLGCLGHDDSEDKEDPTERHHRDIAHRRAKMAKKGWSATKLERWEAQQRAVDRKQERGHAFAKGATLSLEEWRSLLSDLSGDPAIGGVGVLIHMFGGGVAEERIDLAGRQALPMEAIDDAALLRLKRDTLYDFSYRPSRRDERT